MLTSEAIEASLSHLSDLLVELSLVGQSHLVPLNALQSILLFLPLNHSVHGGNDLKP